LRAEHGELQARQRVVQCLLWRIARQLDHHLVLNEAGLLGWRQVEVAAGPDVEPGRIVDACNRWSRRTLLLLLLLLRLLVQELHVEEIGRRRRRIDRIVVREQQQRRLRQRHRHRHWHRHRLVGGSTGEPGLVFCVPRLKSCG